MSRHFYGILQLDLSLIKEQNPVRGGGFPELQAVATPEQLSEIERLTTDSHLRRNGKTGFGSRKCLLAIAV